MSIQDDFSLASRRSRLLIGSVALLALVVVVQGVLLISLSVGNSDGQIPAASSSALAPPIPPTPLPVTDIAVGQPVPAAGLFHHVVYSTEMRFLPDNLEIGVGETVVFVNASGIDFWPASNIHPTHDILPEFDSLSPVPTGQVWQYTFVEAGRWQYHDHLNPSEGGVIIVVAAVETSEPTRGLVQQSEDVPTDEVEGGYRDELEPLVIEMPDVEFSPLPDDATARHVEIYTDDGDLEYFIERFGPANTLRVLKEIELDTNGDCHTRAHEAGRVAYEKFGPAAFALASHECQSGGFHGATEALFASRGTANLAADVAVLCSGSANAFIRHQCLHGIGHGIMAWSNYELHQALTLCDTVPKQFDQQSCYSGVYMENVVGGLSGAMGHTTEYLRPDDPIYPCDVVAEKYQPDCYFYQTSHMLRVFDYDLAAVAQTCTDAPVGSRLHCFNSFGRDAATIARNDPATTIEYCNHTSTLEEHIACTRGAVQNGFWEPSGASRAVQFCLLMDNYPTSMPASREICYLTIIARARDIIRAPTERHRFCNQLPLERQTSCQQTLNL